MRLINADAELFFVIRHILSKRLCYNGVMVKLCQTAFLILFCFFAVPVNVKAMEFQFPVACRLMVNCWITNHVDLDDRVGRVSDYMCGEKATDNNKSTHISLGSVNAVAQNIPVLAAADGEIVESGYIGGFCGTRVLIKHAEGWETSYCHLNPETLQVRAGQQVIQGQIIGSIGMSGQAEWPRLSFATIRNGMVFDPFSGRTAIEGCSATTQSLWQNGMNPPYEPAAVTNAGFTVGYTATADILNGTAEAATAMRSDTLQLSLWALMMNLRVGDIVHMSVVHKNGTVLKEYEQKITTDKTYFPINLSIIRKNILWDAGHYVGTIKITRNVHGNEITSGRLVDLELVDVD